MASYTISPIWGAGAQLFDNSGNVLTGGKIYTYLAGTTTPVTTYTTPTGSTANSNPIIANAAGRLTNEIWLPIQYSYKFVLKDANDVLIATYDNIPTLPQPAIVNDASSISYEQGYTVDAGNFTIGETYLITFVGTTDFTLIGASANTTGIHFVATGIGSGTGTAKYTRTVQARLRDVVSVKDFGAVGDGVTDDRSAFVNAITYVNSIGGGAIYIPQGIYNLKSGTIDPGLGSIYFYGDYEASILLYDEGTNASPKGLFYSTANTAKNDLIFENITIRGTYTTSETNRGFPAVFLDHYQKLVFKNCRWESCANMATDLHFNDYVVFDGCFFVDIGRDGARARDCFYTEVVNCTFRRMGDDSVAWHTAQYTPVYNPDDGSPRREGLIVSNNFFADVKTCVSALGARIAKITNNIAVRQQGLFAYVVQGTFTGFAEGLNPMYGIDVSNNGIYDSLATGGSSFPAIYVQGAAPRGTAASSNVIPGFPDSSGSFVMPWNYNNIQVTDAADPIPPLRFVTVCGNTIARTLPTAVNYVDLGYGYAGSSDGLGWNPAITSQEWSVGIAVGPGYEITISDNNVSHCDSAIRTLTNTGVNPSSQVYRITNNSLFDIRSVGIETIGASTTTVNLLIDGNFINCDVYRRNSNSLPTGKYTNQFTTPRGLRLEGFKESVIKNNIFKNVAQTYYTASSEDDYVWDNNVVICNPVAVGGNANNVGIGNIPNPSVGFRYIIEDCDPQSATWGQVINVCVSTSSSIPTTGTYVRGTVVRKTVPSIAGTAGSKYIVTGWIRLTTGSGHVLNTDWAELRTLTGT